MIYLCQCHTASKGLIRLISMGPTPSYILELLLFKGLSVFVLEKLISNHKASSRSISSS